MQLMYINVHFVKPLFYFFAYIGVFLKCMFMYIKYILLDKKGINTYKNIVRIKFFQKNY